MGINWSYLQIIDDYGLLRPGCSILDFGSSNLYGATADAVANFIRRHNPGTRLDVQTHAARIAAGSLTDANGGALNQSFAGEVLEAAGMVYESIDIADGYKTRLIDLNVHSLPADMRNVFDLVLNFGTSEHILNQYNVFKAIHDAAKPGGIIFHQVPAAGYTDHGYYSYTSRFFFDVCGYNEYELIDFWFDEPAGEDAIYFGAEQYQRYFPALERRLALIGKESRETRINDMRFPNITINILVRKQIDAPFAAPMETSTSVGEVSPAATGPGSEQIGLVERARRAVHAFVERRRNSVRGQH